MSLTFNWNRSKLDVSLPKTDDVTVRPTQEGGIEFLIPFTIDDVVLDAVTETNCDAASGSAVITKNAGTFGDIRAGDLITGDANLPVGGYVLSKDSDTQITLNAVTTGAISNATLIANDAGSKTVSATIFMYGVTINPSLNVWSTTPCIYLFDGTKTNDSDNDGIDNVGKADNSGTIKLSTQSSDSFNLKIDDILTAMRSSRTNT